ncbi:MAG: YggS family pyridoxal phosphate-dependent enzyme [Clostridia bacterium]|nr:YggS family pyridoxal phosphate-dependent enzyme [Clostridia bacterium]
MVPLSSEERFKNIEHNLTVIRQKIAFAARESGRKPEDVKLMAVTKTVEPIFINHAIECGIDLIGENKVQEFLSKKPYLKLDGCEAHLIGHLQTNKVRQIVSEVSMIQSVDSIKLAKEISKRSQALGITTECLIEVNIGDEESKTGLDLALLMNTIEEISVLPSVKIKGLMTIPPICDDDAQLSQYFYKMHEIFVDIKGKKIDNIDMSILSMGMSGDYEAAVRHGSNLVRVGSAIFGPRLY